MTNYFNNDNSVVSNNIHLKKLLNYSPWKYKEVLKKWVTYWLNTYLTYKFDIQISASHINRFLIQMKLLTKQKYKESQQAINVILTSKYTTCSPTVSLVFIGY